jgi:hypothetical protein
MLRERIGILVVHGIGENRRFDHVRAVARDLAEHFRAIGNRVSVTDHTLDGDIPLEAQFGVRAKPAARVTVVGNDRHAMFDFHEVWWADIGVRRGIVDAIGFWMWGLGQWNAPIYRDQKPRKDAKVKLPAMPRWGPALEVWTRVQLAFVALLTVFTVTSWSLLKRIVNAFSRLGADPSIIVQYLGDVQTYEQRARPGKEALSDPSHPARVPVRRRMVGQMVAMATRGYDRWYVLAHSLGTVVAYNGLTEVEETLPNYLTRAQWLALPGASRAVAPADTDVAGMMPARPPWLGAQAALSRQWLFGSFGGFISYGSPLDKFAALWPRIVATSVQLPSTLAGKAWINIYTPFDPVAAKLDAYDALAFPKPRNIAAPAALPLLSHIGYLTPAERYRTGAFIALRRALAAWLVEPKSNAFDDFKRSRWREFAARAVFVLIGIALAVATGAMAALAAMAAALPGTGAVPAFADAFAATMPLVSAVGVWLIVVAGNVRWCREAWRNRRAGSIDALDAVVRALLAVDAAAGIMLAAVGVTLALGALLFAVLLVVLMGGDWLWLARAASGEIYAFAALGFGFGVVCMTVQALVAFIWNPARAAPGADQRPAVTT